MNTTTKMVAASVIVIALCLCAVGGVTYSWFSDSEQAQVDITAGQIDLNMTLGDVYVQSHGGNPIPVADGKVTTDLGGSVTVAQRETNSRTVVTITFEDAAPGDSVTFGISGVLTNTINVYYSEKATVTMPENSTLESPFTITGLTDGAVLKTPSTNEDVAGNDVTVLFGTGYGNDYQGLKMSVEIVFDAVQANAPVVDSIQTEITSDTNSVTVYPEGGSSASMQSASISFQGSNGMSGQTITVSAFDGTDSGYTVQDGSILAGIDVTGADLTGTEVTVSFIIQGNVTSDVLKLYHDGQEVASPGLTATDNSDGTTTVSFTTSAGFSPYYLIADVDAIVGDTYYETLAAAIAAAETDGSTVTLVRDVVKDQVGAIAVTGTVILDLNGFGFTATVASGQYAAIEVTGNMTVEDSAGTGEMTVVAADGILPYSARVFEVSGDGVLTVNGGYITGCPPIFVIDDGTLNLNGGTVDSVLGLYSGDGQYYYGFAIAGNGSESKHITLNINGGTVRSGAVAIYMPGNDSLNISGGEVVGGTTAVEIRSGIVNITGGSITTTATYAEVSPNGSGTSTYGAAVAVSQHTSKHTIEVSISGCTLTGPYALMMVNPQNNAEAASTVSVSLADDVVVNGRITVGYDVTNSSGSVNLTNPVPGRLTTAFNPTEYLDTNYCVATQEGDVWKVTLKDQNA